MAYETHQTIKQLFQKFLRDAYPNLSQAEREALEGQLESRLESLLGQSANGIDFPALIGFGPAGVQPFDQLGYPRIRPDFDDSVIPSQLNAAAELYFIYQ